jgi:hypothetical protein
MHTVASNLVLYVMRLAVLSKAYVCGRLVAGVEGSNLARGMDVCCVYILCCPV